ncbi:hypothetical protein ASG28_11915 [Frigoribacterium sp. Leaf415]|nr:hypothetical protein ASF07_11905 [Frigoribacterium sp. Leaf254]KQT40158.1 hypothetical protein ASG28_11915 [Frigoribacterium sp. Leaf415]
MRSARTAQEARVGPLTDPGGTLVGMSSPACPSRAPRRARTAQQAFPKRLVLTKRTCGTNGWMSLWGSNAHGEIAGCPPPVA